VILYLEILGAVVLGFGISEVGAWLSLRFLLAYVTTQGDKGMGVESVLEHVGEDVLHVVEWPFKNAAELVEYLGVALKDVPEAKTAIQGLIQQFAVIPVDVMADVAANGLNFPKDVQTLADIQAFCKYFLNTFVPQVKAIVGDVKQIEIENAPAATEAAEATDAVQEQPGPGLHNSVPA
jgi:hypothetical protein